MLTPAHLIDSLGSDPILARVRFEPHLSDLIKPNLTPVPFPPPLPLQHDPFLATKPRLKIGDWLSSLSMSGDWQPSLRRYLSLSLSLPHSPIPFSPIPSFPQQPSLSPYRLADPFSLSQASLAASLLSSPDASVTAFLLPSPDAAATSVPFPFPLFVRIDDRQYLSLSPSAPFPLSPSLFSITTCPPPSLPLSVAILL
ncbi:hypothetical protein B296_00006965 [Ensete ventricosum]|uniref:Uncharacterized protein n=1 Tax=Ensete ventricosum TaxID=4639 RepID=A0A427A5A9_ENSVE|nr:hypothetical protein B296_00006965 [Ensete ventricosum]